MKDYFLYHAILEDLRPREEQGKYIHDIIAGKSNLERGLLELYPELTEADVTSTALFKQEQATFRLLARQEGVLSGSGLLSSILRILDPAVEVITGCVDGQELWKGQSIAELQGRWKSVLIGERVVLNFLTHLSGIATRTRDFVQEVEGTGAVILDTRKTIPGLRVYEKEAVRHGGGENHRAGLWDAVLVKNNHIDFFGSVSQVLTAVTEKWGDRYPVIVETRNLEEVEQALQFNITRIMLDNMSLVAMQEAVETIDGRVEVEASGKMTLANVRDVARTGVDFISIGGDLTMSAPRLDMSLQVQI